MLLIYRELNIKLTYQCINDFASQIDKHTKDNIAKTITSDFSTTGSVERVASQITLMESVKSYFEYIVEYIACGIPSITLDGSVEDWKRVREKTMQLKKYGLEKWIDSLDPILQEFILAADGKPNQIFWKSMIKNSRWTDWQEEDAFPKCLRNWTDGC